MKNFRFSIFTIIRILIILALCILLGFIFGRQDLFFSQIIIFFLIILLSLELIGFVNMTNKELKKLLLSIKHKDFTINFPHNRLGKSFGDLLEVFDEVVQDFRNIKIEKEAQLQLLQLIIDQINVGIVAVRSQHEIVFINKKATEILELPGLTIWNIDLPLINKIDKEIKTMKSHGNKLLELNIGDEVKQLAFHVDRTIFLEDDLLLMTFHDIRSEIEQKEIEAWYKLIRILTHEVMNSITPLSSLTETILMLLEEKDGDPRDISRITNEQINDIRSSIKTIQGRSVGILEFVEAYRKLTNIPHPEFQQLLVCELIEETANLFKGELDKKRILLKTWFQNKKLLIKADKHLLEQVFINLISNSIYALEGRPNPEISIKVYTENGATISEIIDNGKGIAGDKIDKIFIPFFSTRENGSGIGLSLSKQIMYLHHGKIKVKSSLGKGATFRVELS